MENFHELVLLVEGSGQHQRLRPRVLTHRNIHAILERCHVAPGRIQERVWRCLQGERSLTGQRIFREEALPAPPEPPEQPMFDELNLKLPWHPRLHLPGRKS